MRDRLRQQLKATQKLSRLLDEAGQAAARLCSSARWQIANPVAALKAKLSPQKSRHLLGYGHLERIVSTYEKWRTAHPEIAAIDEQIQALISGANSTLLEKASPVEPLVPTHPIEFPVPGEVEISTIIPVFNQFRFTQACLASLQEHQETRRFEVIVVDDCSTDGSGERLLEYQDCLSAQRGEFWFHCLLQSRWKRTRQISYFLNNDTHVKPAG